MDEFLQQMTTSGVRYLLIGGQAMRSQDQADIEFLTELQHLGKLH